MIVKKVKVHYGVLDKAERCFYAKSKEQDAAYKAFDLAHLNKIHAYDQLFDDLMQGKIDGFFYSVMNKWKFRHKMYYGDVALYTRSIKEPGLCQVTHYLIRKTKNSFNSVEFVPSYDSQCDKERLLRDESPDNVTLKAFIL